MAEENKILRRLSVKSSTDNLSEVRAFIEMETGKCGFDEKAIREITLAVDEACTNVIKHAYKNLPGGMIHIRLKFWKGRLEISITDFGGSFNPNLVPEPDLMENYRRKKSGGMGIFLMKKLMDEVSYFRLDGNRNRVEMIKHLRASK